MSLPTIHQDVRPLAGLPPAAVQIDWAYWQAVRPRLFDEQPEAPKYLLMPEVRTLLSVVDDDAHRLLFDTLWHTGARISEALQMTPAHFVSAGAPYARVPRSKRRAGRPSRKQAPSHRAVPIEDGQYLRDLSRFITSHKIRQDRRLWAISRQSADNWIKDAAVRAREVDPAFPAFPISCHTLRHSFAVNALLHYRPLRIVQQWLGHRSAKTTAIYTAIFLVDTTPFMRGVGYT